MGAIEAHNVRILGSGEQVVVMSHSFGCDQSVWKFVVPYLLESYRVVLYDNMGAGSTNPDDYDFDRYSTLDGYVDDLISILDELQVKACVFVGHSIKAMVGAAVSICRLDLVSKLVTLCATPRLLNDNDYDGGFKQEEVEEMFEAIRTNYDTWCLGFAPMIVGADMESAVVQEFSRTLFNMRPDITLNIARLIYLGDLRHILPMIKVPWHILQSSNDLSVPSKICEYMHKNTGGPSVIELMPTSGHLPQLSSPDVVVRLLLRHIALDLTKPT